MLIISKKWWFYIKEISPDAMGTFFLLLWQISGKTRLFISENHDLHRIAAMINQPKSQLTSRIIKQHVETNRKILEILNFSSFLFFFLEIVKSLRPKQDL